MITYQDFLYMMNQEISATISTMFKLTFYFVAAILLIIIILL